MHFPIDARAAICNGNLQILAISYNPWISKSLFQIKQEDLSIWIRPCSLAPDGLKYILPYEKYEVPSCFGLKRGAFSLPKTSFALIPLFAVQVSFDMLNFPNGKMSFS